MKWQSGLVLALSLLGLTAPTSVALAQAMGTSAPDPSCACHAPPDSSETPGDTPGRTMLIFGAAGLAVLSGVPFGGTSLQGLPFAAAPTDEALPTGVQVADAAGTMEPQAPAATLAAPPGVTLAPVPAGAPVIPEMAAQAGMVPPTTATHLPLLAAAGLLMVGGGGLLARRDSRERRRRRRFVAL
ncbi:MAG: hypothetical protein ACYC2G_02875 [Gemmatimonadaceae bacterium]